MCRKNLNTQYRNTAFKDANATYTASGTFKKVGIACIAHLMKPCYNAIFQDLKPKEDLQMRRIFT